MSTGVDLDDQPLPLHRKRSVSRSRKRSARTPSQEHHTPIDAVNAPAAAAAASSDATVAPSLVSLPSAIHAAATPDPPQRPSDQLNESDVLSPSHIDIGLLVGESDSPLIRPLPSLATPSRVARQLEPMSPESISFSRMPSEEESREDSQHHRHHHQHHNQEEDPSAHPYAVYLAHQAPLLQPLPSPPPTAGATSPGLSALCELRMDASLSHGFLFLFLDRLIEEGENFLLYSYPSSSATARRVLGMRGVLSVLEGAVAGVTGQKARIGVMEELSFALENSDAPVRPTAGQPASLKVKACTRELSDVGRGIAFVCLTWCPDVSDDLLYTLSRNLLAALRTTLGPIHLALFKPWLLVEERRKGSKKKEFAMKEHWKHQSRSSAMMCSPLSAMRQLSTESTASATSVDGGETNDDDLHPPVRASAFLQTPPPPAASAAAASAARVFPSDYSWLASHSSSSGVASRSQSGPGSEPTRRLIDALEEDEEEAKVDDGPTSTPSKRPAPSSPSAPASPTSSAAAAAAQTNNTVLCSSYESMHLLDTFFRQAATTICRDVLDAAPALGNKLGASTTHALGGAPFQSPATPRGAQGASPKRLTRRASFGSAAMQAMDQSQPVDAAHAANVAASSFLSPSAVPQYGFPRVPPVVAPSATSPSSMLALASPLSPIASSVDPIYRVIDETMATLLTTDEETTSPSSAGAAAAAATASSSSASLPPIGAVLFHRGRLVHVAQAHGHHSSPFMHALNTVGSASPSSSFYSPDGASGSGGLATQTIRPTDVHEISNFLTLMGLFAPLPSVPTVASAAAASSSGSSSSSVASASLSSPALLHASTHQVWFAYAPGELSEAEAAEKFHIQCAPGAFSPIGRSASTTTTVHVQHLLSTSTRGHLAKSASHENLQLPFLSMSSASATASQPVSLNSPTHEMLAGPSPMASPMSSFNGGGGGRRFVLPSPTTATMHPFADAKVYQPKTISVMQIGRQTTTTTTTLGQPTSFGGELVLVVVLASPPPSQADQFQSRALRHSSSDDARPYERDHAFFFALDQARPRRLLEAMERLYVREQVHQKLDAPTTLGVAVVAGGEMNARAILAKIVDTVGSQQSLPPGGALSPHGGGGGLSSVVSSGHPPPLSLHMRSQSSMPRFSLGGGTTLSDVQAVGRHSTLVGGASSILSPRTLATAHKDAVAPTDVLYDFTVLDVGRGVVVRPVTTPDSTGHSTPSSLQPGSFSTDFHALCRRIHSIFARFRPTAAAAAASASSVHASREEMGRGNHIYFQKHKTMETIKHVHECGYRLTYPSGGPTYWVRGRLLANACEVYVCCDEKLPADVLEATFAHMQQA